MSRWVCIHSNAHQITGAEYGLRSGLSVVLPSISNCDLLCSRFVKEWKLLTFPNSVADLPVRGHRAWFLGLMQIWLSWDPLDVVGATWGVCIVFTMAVDSSYNKRTHHPSGQSQEHVFDRWIVVLFCWRRILVSWQPLPYATVLAKARKARASNGRLHQDRGLNRDLPIRGKRKAINYNSKLTMRREIMRDRLLFWAWPIWECEYLVA